MSGRKRGEAGGTAMSSQDSGVGLREEVDDLLAKGDAAGAAASLRRLWREAPSTATAAFVTTRFEQLRGSVSLGVCRLYVARSFTVEPIVPLLRAEAFAEGVDLDVELGAFNAYAQEILDGNSRLYVFSPDVVLLAVQTRDLVPQLWSEFADLDRAQAAAAVVETRTFLGDLVTTLRERTRAHVVVHNLELPALPLQGMLDAQQGFGQGSAIRRLNRALEALARELPNVTILDYDALVARHGRDAWLDERKWLTARMPIAAPQLTHLAREWLRVLYPIAGNVSKAIAVDLDNTLWGGVIGEDGLAGIRLDDEYPGAAYRALQRALLDLHRRGVMLAVCSKNNSAEALEAIERHPGMILKPEHFSAIRINWKDKAENLIEIAAELNIGLDAVAFLDDNPVEREFIRRRLPELRVIELPDDPLHFAKVLRETPSFERLALTEEDRARGRYYAEQRQRRHLEQSATSLEDFLRSLEMKVRIERVHERTVTRAAQLTQKTNQFNLTTRRYTEQELRELMASPNHRLFTSQVIDRFGDNGVVGLAILDLSGDDTCEIDTLLLSCRVIGRGVETALLANAVEEAVNTGATKIGGEFIPTKKNEPAREFYPSHGFEPSGPDNGYWALDLATKSVSCPQWIELEVVDEERAGIR